MNARYLAPLLVFVALAALLGLQLGRAPAPLPSALLQRPVPDFTAPQLDQAAAPFSPTALRGQVWLLNVWASWCTSCRAEHEQLAAIGREGAVPLVGLNYEDPPAQGAAWLAQRGNPYGWTPRDPEGRIGMDLGVYGVPETFVIDREGRIRLRHAGPLTPEVWQQTIRPLIEALRHG